MIALVALFVLAGCHEASGWGCIGLPTDGAIPVVPNGKANFAFTYHCDPKRSTAGCIRTTTPARAGLLPGTQDSRRRDAHL